MCRCYSKNSLEIHSNLCHSSQKTTLHTMPNQRENSRQAHQNDVGCADNTKNTVPNVNPGESSLKVEHTTKITDLNDHCLEKIFMHLNYESLLHVANANKWLQIPAASVYGRKFGKSPVNLCSMRNCSPRVYTFGEYICVDSLKFSLAFLRCFGEKIPELILFCRQAYACACDEYIDRYMNQYCANTLSSLHLMKNTTISNDSFPKPFVNVELVQFWTGTSFGFELQSMLNWFPNVKHLNILSQSMIYPSNNVHFTHLEHLSMPIKSSSWNMVSNFLRSNPQLQSLEVKMMDGFNKTMDDFLDLIADNPSISKLNVDSDGCGRFVNVNETEIQRFVSERRSIVELILPTFVFATENVMNLIGQLNSLKQFCFRINDEAELDRFISQVGHGWRHKWAYTFNLNLRKHHYSVRLER